MNPTALLALLGGTFDPVHYGHLRLASEVREALEIPRLLLVPGGDPPHRGAPSASASDRVAMLGLAVQEFPGLAVDTREITRAGKSYTFDTLMELRIEAPARPLALVVGADAFRGLPAWHRFRELFELAHVILVPRPGVAPGAGWSGSLEEEFRLRQTGDAGVLRTRTAGSIYVQPVTAQPISSTMIRRALAAADIAGVRGLLPGAVLTYIESRQLYRNGTNAS